MVCIYCSSTNQTGDLTVTNSRPQKSRNQTWRRRLCKRCGAVFTSVEAIDLSQTLIVATGSYSGKNANAVPASANLAPFNRDKLFISIYESLRHRPSAASDARGLADTVVAKLIKASDQGLITAQTIVETILSTLQLFDKAAATHYAAFHRL